ncbi:MAG: hypothetical protein KGJ24_13040, partial [Burkholderiales bacterium]|nr:hypothetical protein [Burkholderiales bacterium]
RPPEPGLGALARGTLGGLAATLAAAAAWTAWSPAPAWTSALGLLGGIVSLALAPLGISGPGASAAGRRGWRLVPLGAAFIVALVYFAWHGLFARVGPAEAAALPAPLLALVALAFALLFALQALIALAPRSAWVGRLHGWFFGGLFLDEAFSRVAFALWPPPAPSSHRPAGLAWPTSGALDERLR